MKTHEEIRGMLAAMAGNDLSENDCATVRQHLAECPACRNELAQLQAVVQAVRETPDVEPPAWLAARIMAQVREEKKPKRHWLSRLFLPLHIKLPMEGLALLMVCVVAWYVMQDMDRSQEAPLIPPKAQAPASESIKEGPSPPATATRQEAPPAPEVKIRLETPPSPAVKTAQETSASVPPRSAAPPSPARESAALLYAPPAPGNDQGDRGDRAVSKAASEVAPAPPRMSEQTAAGMGEQGAGGAAPTTARKKATLGKAEKDLGASASAVMPTLRLRLVVDDRETFNDKLSFLVGRLGGAMIVSKPGHSTIRVAAARLPELLAQAARIGRIIEGPEGALPRYGTVELQVVW